VRSEPAILQGVLMTITTLDADQPSQNESDRPRLLLCSFVCHPSDSAESRVGWNRAVQAARFFKTYVICPKPFDPFEMESAVSDKRALANLRLFVVPRGRVINLIERLPCLYYVAYWLWQIKAYQHAKRLHARYRFDLIHQVNLVGFREPGYWWRLGISAGRAGRPTSRL
jgi:hypothetical protein